MKQLQWLVVMFLLATLSGCGAHPPTFQPSTSVSPAPLQTASEYLLRGDTFATVKDYRQAILDYDQAIRLDPDYAEAYNNRSYAQYWNGNAAQAIADYSRAIELRSAYAYAYNNRGAAYMASGHPSQAVNDFSQALVLQPDFPQAYINRGNAYLRLGHVGLALTDFRQGGANPLRSLALLCGVAIGLVLLGVLTGKALRRQALAQKRRGIEKR